LHKLSYVIYCIIMQNINKRVLKIMFKILSKVALIGAMLVSTHALSTVTSFQLENGLNVLIKEDHRAPSVVHQLWYRVGSNYEHNGITGISHMLEHMMFKGTKNYKEGEFSKTVTRLGGRENAFTSSDHTVYFQIVGKQHLETVMKFEADRMNNLVLNEDAFQKERDVVIEERIWRTDDRPSSKLFEQFKATAFLSSPARLPVIGWMEDIKSYQLSDLASWYARWYAPNNATLVIVGAVNPKQVREWAEKYYGVHSAEKIVPPKPQLEIKQEGERRLTLKGATKLPEVMMGFHVPTLVTAKVEDNVVEAQKEAYALSMLSSLLDGDELARLPKRLVREQKILASVGTSYRPTSRLKSLFMIQATPSAGVTTEAVEKAIWAELKILQTELVSQKELDRVLAQAESSYVFGQDSIQGQAMILGTLASNGLSISTLDNWVDNLAKVTPEDVKAVANKYFSVDQSTVGILLPNGEKDSKKPMPSHAGALR